MASPQKGTAPRDEEQKPASPSVSLPKGGGAIKGLGEKFAANPVTGTGSMSVPIATSPGRSGFGPQLALSYDSSSGNGPFGFGWSLSLPSITRKTDKGLPQYWDAVESDVFILSGAEDLVPLLKPDHTRFGDDTTAPGYVIHRYRPRIEGLFARIERWTNTVTAEIHWRSITRDNITSLYGMDRNSRISDPDDPTAATRIFSWLICQSYDDKGNAIVYEYAEENGDKVDLTQANERNRVRTANRYVKRIKYGNLLSRLVQPDLTKASWLFEVVFDYDEGHYKDVDPDPARPVAEQHRFALATASVAHPWSVRPDPFSSHRACYEVRTYRRCRRVLMFHHIPDLPTGEKGYDGLVRSTEFDYADLDYTHPVAIDDELAHQGSTRIASFIQRVTQSGYVLDDTKAAVVSNGVQYSTYLRKSLPPLQFEYSKATIQSDVRDLAASSYENLPVGLDGTSYRWVDLDGEGVSGILTEQAHAWFYKPNLGDGEFGALQSVGAMPSLAALPGGRQQLLDLAGDGELDVVDFSGPTPGFFERTFDDNWKPFRPFRELPNLAWDDPNLRFVDLDGDGHADVLITEADAIAWHPSLGEHGFGPGRRRCQPWDEEQGPRLVFADGTQSVYVADMCGDGLAALVRVRNGEVCFWANCGYGTFGPKVTLDNAPVFDSPDQFDQRRVRLADIDGSGTNDVIYLAPDGVRLYFNQSGNRLSDARPLPQFPRINNITATMTADLLGNGTACLVWSSPLAADSQHPLRYVDLMGGIKPHLLVKSINNLGAETEVQYAASTKFYLADKLAGRPWITRVPFPVYVAERVDTCDRISGNRFVTRYAYHHGFFDGVEREFRGFGMVEQWDTEEFAALNAGGQAPAGTNVDATSHVPPIHTKTWYHTGVYIGRDHVSDYFAGLIDAGDSGEYYREPGRNDAQARALLLDDTILPDDLTVADEREACRALKGSMLRQEVYALDGTKLQDHPYTVTEQNFSIRMLQARGANRHGVFLAHPRESLSYHYERDPADPRVGHALTLTVDDFGNVLRSAAIGYGRRQPDATLPAGDQPKQTQILITCTENQVTKSHDTLTDTIDTADDYRTPLPCESCIYELTGKDLPAGAVRFTFDEILSAVNGATPLANETDPTPGLLQRRPIRHSRIYYRSNDLTGPLPLGHLQSMALPFETFKLAFTPGLVTQVYGGRAADAMLASDGCYAHTEGDTNWWAPSGLVFYSPDPLHTPAEELAWAKQHFFLPTRSRDPFHTAAVSTESFVTYDLYDLLVQETRDPLGSRVTAGERDQLDPTQPPTIRRQDYRVLQPDLVMDPNRNCSEVRFDALGMVAGTAVMGKPGDPQPVGDKLAAAFHADLTQSEIDQFFAAPMGPSAFTLLDDATTRIVYDVTAYYREPDPARKPPAVAAILARETHVSDPVPAGGLRIQASLSYSDGFGHEIQKKIQAEPGPVPTRDINGSIVVDAGGQPMMTTTVVSPRWVGTGWTILNNKGKAVRQYEPFFTDTHHFEFDVRIGVSPVMFYDPVQRVVATLHPNHTWEKVVFDPWRQETWDATDTVLIADPAADGDVGDYFSRLPVADYLPTWSALRTDPANAAQATALWPDQTTRDAEKSAADKSAVHAATPTVAHADSLGRPFLTIAHNKAKYSNTPTAAPPVEEFQSTRVTLDIEGKQREVIDAAARVVMRYDFDMLGQHAHQKSMEAGERWTLNDVSGKPVHAWDSRSHEFITAYDALRRPTAAALVQGVGAPLLIARTVYGETQPTPEKNNLRGKVVELRDQAGIVTSSLYDFKGNLLHGQRQLAQEYKATIDWSGVVPMHVESYASRTRYDALNRPTQLIAPHSDQPGFTVNVIQPSYNEANLLEQVDVWLQQNAEPLATLASATASLHAVTDVDYDAKGQRTLIDYGNGVRTTYEYDPLTLRLSDLITRRDPAAFPGDCPPLAAWPGCQVQSLHYTYDPMGNVTGIRDDAQQAVYFKNILVEPSADYVYDAVYRLIEATGREHLGQAGGSPIPHSYNDAPRVGIWNAGPANSFQPQDGNALGRYCESYVYDSTGNLTEMAHRLSCSGVPSWSRTYAYSEPSQIKPSIPSNRLTSTTVGGTTETYSIGGNGYDAHGNMLRMPHLQVMQWDFKDQLQMTQRQAVNPTDADGNQHKGERTWYVYDSAGQRVRKVRELATGQISNERVYLGGFEVYRANGANPLVRETLHVMDDKRRIALVETRTSGNEPGVPPQLIRYQFSNHLGSASLELDDQAQIISYEEYTPYGSTAYQAVRSQTDTRKRYRYTGKERDEESGLYYHGARYYAAWLAKWISTDPSGPSDTLNLYAFVRGNPVRLTDPTGRYSWEQFGSDVWTGVKGIAEPALIVMDFGQMGAALITQAIAPESYHDVEWLSATGKHFAQNPNEGLATNLFHTVVEPEVNIVTGGAYGLTKNIVAAVESGDPDKAQSILVQGAAGQVASVGIAMAGAKYSGAGWTGRGSSPATLENLTAAEINKGVEGPTDSNVMVKIPAGGLEPIKTTPYGEGGQQVKIPTQAQTSVPDATGDVKTTVRFHDADPTAPEGTASRGQTTMAIEQAGGGRRFVPDATLQNASGGRWVQRSTASSADWGRSHIPLFNSSGGQAPFFPWFPLLLPSVLPYPTPSPGLDPSQKTLMINIGGTF